MAVQIKYNYFKDKDTFRKEFVKQVESTYAVDFKDSTTYQQYVVLGNMLRRHVAYDWKKTEEAVKSQKLRSVYYFSMEFLMGRMITNNLMNAGVRGIVSEAFNDLGLDINDIEHQEADAGLGNGGLGRLAACFMDSVASLGLPVHGNCIRYRLGFFDQDIVNGYQVERPDMWLKDTHVWEVRKDSEAVEIPFYGYVEYSYQDGRLVVLHRNAEVVKAVPYDVPVIGDRNNVVNTLRLWQAEAMPNVSHDAFNYNKRLADICSQLYPDDSTYEGKELRLKQQYFFSAAGVKAICKKHKEVYGTLTNLHKKVCFHINDTHPTLIIPELMRILVDEEGIAWEEAWNIVKNSCAYTNHTILAEALEKWPVELVRNLLPRIYTIIEEINRRLVIEIENNLGHGCHEAYQMAVVKDGLVHMANLAIAGSFSVNGVAALHTDILKNIEMKVFNDYYPGKFNNKTNGITHRRWCYHTNPELVEILNEYCGEEWVRNTDLLEKLALVAEDSTVQEKFNAMKLARKEALAKRIYESQGIQLDTNSIFDIQVKRLHEYKRQLLNALHIMYVYNELKNNPEFKANYHPHTFIFGAKSAPSYYFAKKVIKLINCISDKVNNDPETNHLLKVVFVINYNVTYAESIMPACDISEQISTASKEASGTGNMKFMMNGGITLGTLDGANVEIKEFVGDDNIIIFGMNSDEVNRLYLQGGYNPFELYNNDPRIKTVIDNLTNGFFNNVDPNEFVEIRNKLLQRDEYFVLKDFDAYVKAHEKANEMYKDRKKWLQMSLVNISKSGNFSTDRTMEDYNRDIWKLTKIGEIK